MGGDAAQFWRPASPACRLVGSHPALATQSWAVGGAINTAQFTGANSHPFARMTVRQVCLFSGKERHLKGTAVAEGTLPLLVCGCHCRLAESSVAPPFKWQCMSAAACFGIFPLPCISFAFARQNQLVCGMFAASWQSCLTLILILVTSRAIYRRRETTKPSCVADLQKAVRVLSSLTLPRCSVKVGFEKLLPAASPCRDISAFCVKC